MFLFLLPFFVALLSLPLAWTLLRIRSRPVAVRKGLRIVERFVDLIVMLVAPLGFLWLFRTKPTFDCCAALEFQAFSAPHLPSLLVPYGLAGITYLFQSRSDRLLPPLWEALTLALFPVTLALDVFVAVQVGFVLVPVVLTLAHFAICLGHLERRTTLVRREVEAGRLAAGPRDLALRLLLSPRVVRYPAIALLALPVQGLVCALLVVFGQRPDSLVLVFTQSFQWTFSRLEPLCASSDSCGMYLVTIGSHGHPRLVGRVRPGRRGGAPILCTRQLLVSNAFEQSLEERLPRLWRMGRDGYDLLGAILGRFAPLFRNPWVCDAVYLAMKPAEWAFLAWLYATETRPENRIARQYRP